MIGRSLSLAVGAAITAVAIWYLVTPQVAEELATITVSANWWALALALISSALVQWLRAWRFAIMTTGSLSLPGLPLVRIAFQLNLLNFVLPFRLGELGYPVLMRRAYGQPILSAAGVLVLARIFDLCSVGALLAATSAALGLAAKPSVNAVLWLTAAGLALTPVALVAIANALPRRIAALPRAEQGPPSPHSAIRSVLAERPVKLAAIGLSFAIWLVFGTLAALAANAVAVVPPVVALLGASAANLAFALPINGIGGLGPSQAAWVLVVSQAGIAWTEAVISALSVYVVTLAGAVLFGSAALMVPGAPRDISRT